MNIFQKIAAWVEHFLHKHHAGEDVPLPPKPGEPPVLINPAPAPSPAPVAPPASTPAPAALIGVPGMQLADPVRGLVSIDAIDHEIATNPAWAKACRLYDFFPAIAAFSLTGNAALSVDANTSEANIEGEGPAGNTSGRLNATSLGQSYLITPPDREGSQFTRGLPSGDALAFPKHVTLADIPAFIANCNADYQAALERRDDPIRVEGCLPIIDHSHSGPVATR